jgi:hypothetical protein
MPWHQRVRESAFVRGKHAYATGAGRESSQWHQPSWLPETVTDREARAAFELGWDTAHRANRENPIAAAS